MILGDNIYYGNGLSKLLKEAIQNNVGATVFGYYVDDPERFGVVEFDESSKVISIEEKPKTLSSSPITPILYIGIP